MLDSTELKLLHLLLQVGDIFPAIADIRIHPLLHEGIIGRTPHVSRSSDQGLLPLDLAVDRGNEFVPVHFDDWRRGRGRRVDSGYVNPFKPRMGGETNRWG